MNPAKTTIALIFRSILIILLLEGVASAQINTQTDSGHSNEALMQSAATLLDIRAPGAHSFRLTAKAVIVDEEERVQEGTYLLSWDSPTVWKDELRFPGFAQVRIAKSDRLFTARNPSTLSLNQFQFLQSLRFPEAIRLYPGESASTPKQSQRLSGRKIELRMKDSSSTTIYFDNPPLPTRMEFRNGTQTEFGDYRVLGEHQFPFRIRKLRSKKLAMELDIQELVEESFAPSVFATPPNSPSIRWCLDPSAAEAIPDATVIPIPWPLRDGALRKHVSIYGVIGTDGLVSNATVVRSAGKEADEHWMNSMKHVRFSPAKCGQDPIVQEIVLDFFLP